MEQEHGKSGLTVDGLNDAIRELGTKAGVENAGIEDAIIRAQNIREAGLSTLAEEWAAVQAALTGERAVDLPPIPPLTNCFESYDSETFAAEATGTFTTLVDEIGDDEDEDADLGGGIVGYDDDGDSDDEEDGF